MESHKKIEKTPTNEGAEEGQEEKNDTENAINAAYHQYLDGNIEKAAISFYQLSKLPEYRKDEFVHLYLFNALNEIFETFPIPLLSAVMFDVAHHLSTIALHKHRWEKAQKQAESQIDVILLKTDKVISHLTNTFTTLPKASLEEENLLASITALTQQISDVSAHTAHKKSFPDFPLTGPNPLDVIKKLVEAKEDDAASVYCYELMQRAGSADNEVICAVFADIAYNIFKATQSPLVLYIAENVVLTFLNNEKNKQSTELMFQYLRITCAFEDYDDSDVFITTAKTCLQDISIRAKTYFLLLSHQESYPPALAKEIQLLLSIDRQNITHASHHKPVKQDNEIKSDTTVAEKSIDTTTQNLSSSATLIKQIRRLSTLSLQSLTPSTAKPKVPVTHITADNITVAAMAKLRRLSLIASPGATTGTTATTSVPVNQPGSLGMKLAPPKTE